LSKIPTPVWVCLTAAFLGTVGAFAFLSYTGSDAAEFRGFLNIVMNLANLLVTGGALAYAGQAAQQTNGGLDKRVQAAARAALVEQRVEDTEPGGELRR
jgi:hypothetical protein